MTTPHRGFDGIWNGPIRLLLAKDNAYMRARLATFLTLLVTLIAAAVVPMAAAAPTYSGYFGEDNFPPGCIRDMSQNNPDNICYHMRTDMNGLDSPQVDVLVMVPVSPTAERDMRIMRQSVEMWENGVQLVADRMGLEWLEEGLQFHITVDAFDPNGDGGEFTTYPIVDPEIVIIATNPVGGIGIGIDPVDFAGDIFPALDNQDTVTCYGVANPFDFEQWENLPGFDSHHEERSGTYTEDCDGAGGNICFAVNGAIDPTPGTLDVFGLFDLVSHEFGHCMTIGHVGDGAEGDWGALPSNDIMAYHTDPPGLNKCISSLDVEGVATVMSRYLDVNGDGVVDGNDELLANDQIGEGSSPFQVQHPDNHFYASSTGSPLDCPQPDLGLVPGERTNWSPDAVDAPATTTPVLTVDSPADGAATDDGVFTVAGSVERQEIEEEVPPPTGSFDDADDDASTPFTEILGLDVGVSATHLDGVISLADLWPSTDVTSAVSYSLLVNGRSFDSFVRYAVDPNPMTWDAGAAAYMPAGTSTWDLDAKTVSFHIPLEYLDAANVMSPYAIGSTANLAALTTTAAVDDSAPESGESIPVAGARILDVARFGANAGTIDFQYEGGNTFYLEESTLGVPPFLGDAAGHVFALNVTQPSDVEFTMSWTDDIGGSDLDLYVTGAASSGSDGASAEAPETVTLTGVQGFLDIRVEPYLVTDPLSGATYTLTATVTPLESAPDTDGDGVIDAEDQCPTEPGVAPSGCPIEDADGDGVADADDACPTLAGSGADGCPIAATEHVNVYVDGVLAASQDVDTLDGLDAFSLDVTVDEGTHELTIEWEDEGTTVATATRSVTRNEAVVVDSDGDGVPDADDVCPGFDDGADADGDGIPDGCDDGDVSVDGDRDGDGVADEDDNCPKDANADQADMDGDGEGDACDKDIDGDGHSNKKEEAHGTDPRDPNSYPVKGKGKPDK